MPTCKTCKKKKEWDAWAIVTSDGQMLSCHTEKYIASVSLNQLFHPNCELKKVKIIEQ